MKLLSLILLGLMALASAKKHCPDQGSIPEDCFCEYFAEGEDEDKDTTILACIKLNQAQFENLTKTMNGYKLDQFDITQSSFTRLHKNAFENITIGILTIEDTPISEVDANAFADIPHLRELSIRNTKITEIPPLKHVAHSLVEMILEKNELKHVHKNQLEHLTGLKVVIMDHNDIQHVEDGVFHGLKDIIEVGMEDNNISKVGNWFEFNSTLQMLDLSDNFISELPENFFDSVPDLRELDLEENNFEDLPEKTFKKFVEFKDDVIINVLNNRLICDTRLCWLYQYLDSVEEIDVHGTCAQPGAFSGRPLDDISRQDVDCATC